MRDNSTAEQPAAFYGFVTATIQNTLNRVITILL